MDIRLRKDSVIDENTLKELIETVRTMAIVHTVSWSAMDTGLIPLNHFIEKIVTGLVSSTTRDEMKITTKIKGVVGWIELERANPLSLVLNELTFNIIKHAYPNGGQGTITILIVENGNGFDVSIADDGVGMDLEKLNEGTMGLKLVRSLTRQIKGKIDWDSSPGNGTTVTINIPKMITDSATFPGSG